MKITFDSEQIAEYCGGCKKYGPHWSGKVEGGGYAFKCSCGRLTIWAAGDIEKVVTEGAK